MESLEANLWHKIFRRLSITVLPYYAGYYLSASYGFAAPSIAGLWSAISGILVLQVTIDETTSAAWLRILGSLIGTITSFILLELMGYSILALGVTIAVIVLLTSIFKIKHTLRLACLTTQVIIIVGMIGNLPILLNCVSRFTESLIGSLIALAVAGLFHPVRKKAQLMNR